ncbi:MAG TPA: hypothetical protein VJT31_04205 [Rugosimonospora sp.]|nr:hypothetical protein [Rugosimonospora sp.]
MKRTWLLRAAAAGAVLLAGVLAPSLAAAGGSNNSNPQAPSARRLVPNATVAPNACLMYQQMNSVEQKYRKTNNNFTEYFGTSVGTGYFNVACGSLSFTVPRGKQALVDLSAVAELDCQGPAGGNTWCEGRFLINNTPVPTPDNTGRSDTFAWDSGNGGAYDWQANSLEQEYVAKCPTSSTTTTPCTYKVQLQSRLDNGATYLWVDDLTVRVDVTLGTVRVTSVTP